MHDCADSMCRENLPQSRAITDIRLHESRSLTGYFVETIQNRQSAVAQIVDNKNLMACVNKFDNCVRANIAGAGVGRTVHLDRPLSDREWAIFVADLRETFDAQGRLRQEGAFRQWTNGNLQALLEPTDSGERLRLKTAKTGARASLIVGVTMSTLGAGVVALSSLASGGVSILGLFGLANLLGGLSIGSRWLRLPRWAATRERQMEEVSDRLVAALSAADRVDETP